MNSPENTNPAVLKSMLDGVESTKPQTGIPVGNTVNFTNNTINSVTVYLSGVSIGMDNAGLPAHEIVIGAHSTTTIYVSCMMAEPEYTIGLIVDSETDQYDITTGSTNWVYNSGKGLYRWDVSDTSPINNQTYNVVISDKTV